MATGVTPLVQFSPEQMRGIADLPSVKEIKTVFPKRAAPGVAAARAAMRRWQESQPVPVAPKNPEVPIEAVSPTRANFAKLRAVVESDVALAELMKQDLDDKALFGTLYSALSTLGYMRMQAEYKRLKATGRDLENTERLWKQQVSQAQAAFAAGGLQVKPVDLDQFVQELNSNKATLNAVLKIAQSATGTDEAAKFTAKSKVTASFVAVAERVTDLSPIVTPIAGLCDGPLKQGSFTKHFARSLSLSVRIRYWCPKWNDWSRMCTKTITLAGISFDVGVNVGYKITCCGATAWGQGYAQACATIIGFSVCASCTATITAVAGVSRTPVGSGCSYGLGINTTLQCKFAGATILYLAWPFGWTVTGPCPPAGACA